MLATSCFLLHEYHESMPWGFHDSPPGNRFKPILHCCYIIVVHVMTFASHGAWLAPIVGWLWHHSITICNLYFPLYVKCIYIYISNSEQIVISNKIIPANITYIYISNKIIPTYSNWSWIFLSASPQRPGWSMLSWLCPWPSPWPWPWPPWLRCCKTSARLFFCWKIWGSSNYIR